MSLTSLY